MLFRSSLVIAAVIFVGTWGLLRDSINYAIDAVPRSIELPEIRAYLMNVDHVVRIHDLHVWPLSTTKVALTVHLVMDECPPDNHFLRDIQQHLDDRFGIEHSTIQIESSAGANDCMLDSPECA